MIISASRRTDIPAFYSDWFMNRINAGYLLTRNPFNAKQIRRVSLRNEDVDAIVFWTRNPARLLPSLPALDSCGFKYYFQYTITGYPRKLEKSVPNPHKAIETFSKLSDTIGSGRVVWRYDPVVLSNAVDLSEHKRLFERIARSLEGRTKRVVISFVDIYEKTARNLRSVDGFEYSDIVAQTDEMLELASFMSAVAKASGMEVKSCSEKVDLSSCGIQHGKCIDDELLAAEFGLVLPSGKDLGQREECGCIKSVDIGQYNTCLHGCVYCYATFHGLTATKNNALHDPSSPFLVGPAQEAEISQFSNNIQVQTVLFEGK